MASREKLTCVRCGTHMHHFGRKQLQLGENELASGALEVDMYFCPQCGKLEFFRADTEAGDRPLPQVTCPSCGQKHNLYDARCPFCGHRYD